MAAQNAIRMLGITSIGLGIFDTLKADDLAARVGMEGGRVFRLAGAREIVTGIGAVLFPASRAPIVARLIGDAIDIAVLSGTAAKPGNDRRNAALIGVGIVLAVTVVDALALASQHRDD